MTTFFLIISAWVLFGLLGVILVANHENWTNAELYDLKLEIAIISLAGPIIFLVAILKYYNIIKKKDDKE